jgi:hypothetical protein
MVRGVVRRSLPANVDPQAGFLEKPTTAKALAKYRITLNQRKAKWSDLGLTRFYSSILIHTTEPARSDTGNTWAALLAATYDEGDALTADKRDAVLPTVKAVLDRAGCMEASSGTLFDRFLKRGAGACPIIVAYENQLLEFAAEHPGLIEPLRRKLRDLYPRPTVRASQPLIAPTTPMVKD